MTKFNVKTASKDEIIKNAPMFLLENNYDDIIFQIIVRDDAKQIFKEGFYEFLINSKDSFYRYLLNPKFKDIFDDAIKTNIRQLLIYLSKKGELERLGSFNKEYGTLICNNIDALMENNLLMSFFLCDFPLKQNQGYYRAIIKNIDLFLDNILFSLNASYANDEIRKRKDAILFFEVLDKLSDSDIKEMEDKILLIINEIIRKLEPSALINQGYKENVKLLNSFSKAARKNDKINEILENNTDFVMTVYTQKNKKTLEEENILAFYLEIFKDILEEEKISFKDIIYDSGFNSIVAITKEKVLKNGDKFVTEIPYHKRLLQPVVRTNILKNMFEENEKLMSLLKAEEIAELKLHLIFTFFEVYEKVKITNIDTADAYEIFKELLEEDIIWADPKKENLGRLLKPNKPYVKGAYVKNSLASKKLFDYDQKYYVDDESVGIISEKGEKEILNKDELVITDLDLIYKSNIKNLKEYFKNELRTNGDISLEDLYAKLNITTTNDFKFFMSIYITSLKQEMEKQRTK